MKALEYELNMENVIVFPAFNESYKTRKRTFKCCQNCRVKRVKCTKDHEFLGCSNCHKYNLQCDLATASSFSSQSPPSKSQSPQNLNAPGPNHSSKSNSPPTNHLKNERISRKRTATPENTSKRRSSATSVSTQTGELDMKTITPQYLKNRFNFNISGPDSVSSYQYVYQDHPKAIVYRKITDKSIYHESGVYVDFQHENPNETPDENSEDSKPYKLRNFDGSERQAYIKNRRTFEFLLSLDAFTLSSENFQITEAEVNDLIKLYFLKLNSIFPIVHTKRFWDDFLENKAQSVIIYAIVLSILRDKMAEKVLKNVFLRTKKKSDFRANEMSNREYHDYFVEFTTELEYKIRQILLILPELGDNDKVTRLSTHLLLSYHFRFDKLGNEQSSHDLCAAINLAGSLGMQMKITDKNVPEEKIEYSRNIWWCCYIFDRFNAIINCRFLFIRKNDFNVELPTNLPYLFSMVKMAKSFEQMLFAIYQPFDNEHRTDDTLAYRQQMFDIDGFQNKEFAKCDEEFQKVKKGLIHEPLQNCSTIEGLQENIVPYLNSSIEFLTRMSNNILILASQKAKYDDLEIPNRIPEEAALRASLNILWYINKTKPELLIQIPLVVWCITLAMACSLKRKARNSLKEGPGNPEPKDPYYGFTIFDYMSTLEIFSDKWWVVEEICHLCKDFIKQLETPPKLFNSIDANHKSSTNDLTKFIPGTPRQSVNSAIQSPVNLNKTKSIPSIKSILTDDFMNGNDPNSHPPTNALPPITTPTQIGNSGPILGNPMNSQSDLNPIQSQNPDPSSTNANSAPQYGPNINGYDDYLESMHIDVFDNEFFKDLPNLMNFMNS